MVDVTGEAPEQPRSFSDGSSQYPTHRYLVTSTFAAHHRHRTEQPSDDELAVAGKVEQDGAGLAISTALTGPYTSPNRAESAGALAALRSS